VTVPDVEYLSPYEVVVRGDRFAFPTFREMAGARVCGVVAVSDLIRELCAPIPSIIDKALVYAMEHGMDYGDAQEIRWAVLGQRTIAWCADQYAGAMCPLRAAGFERERRGGAWTVDGGRAFEMEYDRLMNRYVLPGPGMAGLPRRAA
jgi:hypothetical protein